jgi:hypothetical protein
VFPSTGRTRTTRTRLELAMRMEWTSGGGVVIGQGRRRARRRCEGWREVGAKTGCGRPSGWSCRSRMRDDARGERWRRERDLGNARTCARRRSAKRRRAEGGGCFQIETSSALVRWRRRLLSLLSSLFPTPFLPSFPPSLLFTFLSFLAYALRTDDSPHGLHAPPLPLPARHRGGHPGEGGGGEV